MSIAIPDTRSPLRYRDLSAPAPVSRIVKHLSRDRITGSSRVHMDPDLAAASRTREHPFTAAFGQCGAAQSHLRSHGLSRGDLFLFFGWYRQVEFYKRRWRFLPGAPDLHVIYGWLEVDSMVSVDEVLSGDQYASLRSHPHCFGKFSGENVIYTAVNRLSLNRKHNGAGYFSRINDEQILTAPDNNRSLWQVPDWLYPKGRDSALSYHTDLSRWRRQSGKTLLQSAARGQEFVLNAEHYPESIDWARSLFAASTACSDV